MDDLIKDDEQVEQPVVEKPDRSDKRFQDLSQKVKTTSEENDLLKTEKAAVEKELEFHKEFSKLKQPDALDYQDKIKEKYLAGYDMEDAANSVLIKAGKFTAPTTQRESPMGGSATTAMKTGGEKELGEMTQAEKRAELEQIERESGGISQILRRRNL